MSDYKQFKIERLDPISPTFCAAKWLMSDFYLHTGSTSSCHLPTPDKIDLDLVKQDISYLNNTIEKVNQRQQMLEGKQPSKCSNCWQVESPSNGQAISDRIIYSHSFKNYDFNDISKNIKIDPVYVNISFDTLCNFTCSYCDASQSTSWSTDLLTNGVYKQIRFDPRNTYQRLGINNQIDNYDEVFKKFVEYIISILPKLKKINCLGGEPLISPNFWNFIDTIAEHDTSNTGIKICTNLSSQKNLIKFLSYKEKYKSMEISASIENIGLHAEFLRKGLVWDEFNDNVNFILEQSDLSMLSFESTVPGIALDGLIDFLDWYKELKLKYKQRINLSIFRLRHPNFQAIQVLPKELKLMYKQNLSEWLDKNKHLISKSLQEQIKNVIIILDLNEDKFDNVDIDILQKNAKIYYKEYAKRHKFNIKEIFSSQLVNWLNN
jgi:organic radical activating enzyme